MEKTQCEVFSNWKFNSWFLRRLHNQSKIRRKAFLFDVLEIQIIWVLWFRLSHVTCWQGVRFTYFRPQRPQAVLGSGTYIFGNSSSSSIRCNKHFFEKNNQYYRSYFDLSNDDFDIIVLRDTATRILLNQKLRITLKELSWKPANFQNFLDFLRPERNLGIRIWFLCVKINKTFCASDFDRWYFSLITLLFAQIGNWKISPS